MSEIKEKNELDYTCGLSDDELTQRFIESIRIDEEIRKIKGLPPSGYDADYFKMKGRPLYETRKVSTLSGFTQIGDIHLENIKAFQNEKDELYDLLKSGIIL